MDADPINRESLDWKTRYSIIEGIVRGLIIFVKTLNLELFIQI